MNGANKIFLLLFGLSFFLGSKSQEPFRVMFYNAENLFDTINTPHTFDDEYTPNGKLYWNSYRYRKKLEDISKVISSVGGKYPPAIVGLCEIENEHVIKELSENSSLARHRYKYLITQSKDIRGSNVALLYQRDQIKLITKKKYSPIIDTTNNRTTRDILHMVGQVVNGDTLDVFVCHYPSRSEGVRKSEPFRKNVSKLLRLKVDSLYKIRSKANIIIMGDFNDYPYNTSLIDVLEANPLEQNPSYKRLYNLTFHHKKQHLEIGSYKYRGKWGYLDQFILSGNLLLPQHYTHIVEQSAGVYYPKYLLDYDEKYGGMKPFRTYSGWKYLGGTSDHLPIFFDLYIQESE